MARATEVEEEVMRPNSRNPHGAEDEVSYEEGWQLFDKDIGTQVL